MTTTKNDLSTQFERLEKAGAGHRTSTKDLLEAARNVAREITEIVPRGLLLPRHYRAVTLGDSNYGYHTFLAAECECLAEDEFGRVDADLLCTCPHTTGFVDCEFTGYLRNQFDLPFLKATTRAVAMRFAEDLSGGLLGEIAAMLETRAEQTRHATANIASALPRHNEP